MKSHFIRRNNYLHTQSFSVKHDIQPYFLKLWHHHQELKLVWILRGEGTRFVGDSIKPFIPGDIVLLGEFLPHKWQNNPAYYEEKDLVSEAIIIHFEKKILINALRELVEFQGLLTMIDSSVRGIHFKGYAKKLAPERLIQIVHTPPGLNRMIQLLDLLRILSDEKEFGLITSPGYVNTSYEKDIKLRRVNDYIMNNFQHSVTLKDVADQVSLNKTSFCRYFKKATDKSFSSYLNEIRIGYACKLLQEGKNKTIAEICYESGFNNLSNFNQRFKQVTGYTPSRYARVTG